MKDAGLSRVVLLDDAAPVDKGKARPHSVSDRPCPSTKERNTRTMDPSLDTYSLNPNGHSLRVIMNDPS